MHNDVIRTDCKLGSPGQLPPGTSGITTKDPQEVKLLSVLERLKEENNYTEDVIASIKSRLNTIYVSQEEVGDPEKIPELVVNCAVDEFNWQLFRLYKNNKALAEIHAHLKQII